VYLTFAFFTAVAHFTAFFNYSVFKAGKMPVKIKNSMDEIT